MSDAELQADVEAALAENLANAVTEYSVGNRRVRRDPQMIREQLNALLTLRALQSPKRGLNLGKIDNAG